MNEQAFLRSQIGRIDEAVRLVEAAREVAHETLLEQLDWLDRDRERRARGA